MLVFVSWSGEQSKAVAHALREWLPEIIQSLDPWMSASDIQAGARWGSEIANKLEKSAFGIVVATTENLTAPWINFEAGACAKVVDAPRLCPYLVGLGKAQVTGLLAQFQMQLADEPGTWNLAQSLNQAVRANEERALADDKLRKAFDRSWPELNGKIQAAAKLATAEPVKRSERELLEEVLGVVRGLDRLLAEEHAKNEGLSNWSVT